MAQWAPAITAKQLTLRPLQQFTAKRTNDVRRLEADEESDERFVLSLPNEASLERVLHAKNLEFIRTIASQEPETVRELARFVDRDIKKVSTAVNRLEEIGLVELQDEGHAKRPTIWYDQVEIDIQTTSRGTDDFDAPPA